MDSCVVGLFLIVAVLIIILAHTQVFGHHVPALKISFMVVLVYIFPIHTFILPMITISVSGAFLSAA